MPPCFDEWYWLYHGNICHFIVKSKQHVSKSRTRWAIIYEHYAYIHLSWKFSLHSLQYEDAALYTHGTFETFIGRVCIEVNYHGEHYWCRGYWQQHCSSRARELASDTTKWLLPSFHWFSRAFFIFFLSFPFRWHSASRWQLHYLVAAIDLGQVVMTCRDCEIHNWRRDYMGQAAQSPAANSKIMLFRHRHHWRFWYSRIARLRAS